ncbi:MAG: hypothetical protein ACOC1F_09130 [Myxococcota bacterium]
MPGTAINFCDTPANEALASGAEAAALASLEGVDVSCLWSSVTSTGTVVDVEGGAQADADAMNQRLKELCGPVYNEGIAVVVDPNGAVVGVEQHYGNPVDPEVAACVLKALEGLTFPCLAAYTVCPESIIAE